LLLRWVPLRREGMESRWRPSVLILGAAPLETGGRFMMVGTMAEGATSAHALRNKPGVVARRPASR
jgi:hypothetical protein